MAGRTGKMKGDSKFVLCGNFGDSFDKAKVLKHIKDVLGQELAEVWFDPKHSPRAVFLMHSPITFSQLQELQEKFKKQCYSQDRIFFVETCQPCFQLNASVSNTNMKGVQDKILFVMSQRKKVPYKFSQFKLLPDKQVRLDYAEGWHAVQCMRNRCWEVDSIQMGLEFHFKVFEEPHQNQSMRFHQREKYREDQVEREKEQEKERKQRKIERENQERINKENQQKERETREEREKQDKIRKEREKQDKIEKERKEREKQDKIEKEREKQDKIEKERKEREKQDTIEKERKRERCEQAARAKEQEQSVEKVRKIKKGEEKKQQNWNLLHLPILISGFSSPEEEKSMYSMTQPDTNGDAPQPQETGSDPQGPNAAQAASYWQQVRFQSSTIAVLLRALDLESCLKKSVCLDTGGDCWRLSGPKQEVDKLADILRELDRQIGDTDAMKDFQTQSKETWIKEQFEKKYTVKRKVKPGDAGHFEELLVFDDQSQVVSLKDFIASIIQELHSFSIPAQMVGGSSRFEELVLSLHSSHPCHRLQQGPEGDAFQLFSLKLDKSDEDKRVIEKVNAFVREENRYRYASIVEEMETMESFEVINPKNIYVNAPRDKQMFLTRCAPDSVRDLEQKHGLKLEFDMVGLISLGVSQLEAHGEAAKEELEGSLSQIVSEFLPLPFPGCYKLLDNVKGWRLMEDIEKEVECLIQIARTETRRCLSGNSLQSPTQEVGLLSTHKISGFSLHVTMEEVPASIVDKVVRICGDARGLPDQDGDCERMQTTAWPEAGDGDEATRIEALVDLTASLLLLVQKVVSEGQLVVAFHIDSGVSIPRCKVVQVLLKVLCKLLPEPATSLGDQTVFQPGLMYQDKTVYLSGLTHKDVIDAFWNLNSSLCPTECQRPEGGAFLVKILGRSGGRSIRQAKERLMKYFQSTMPAKVAPTKPPPIQAWVGTESAKDEVNQQSKKLELSSDDEDEYEDADDSCLFTITSSEKDAGPPPVPQLPVSNAQEVKKDLNDDDEQCQKESVFRWFHEKTPRFEELNQGLSNTLEHLYSGNSNGMPKWLKPNFDSLKFQLEKGNSEEHNVFRTEVFAGIQFDHDLEDVKVKKKTPEYREVKGKLRKGLSRCKINKMTNVESKPLKQRFEAKRRQLEHRGELEGERVAWQRVDPPNAHLIVKYGCQKKFCYMEDDESEKEKRLIAVSDTPKDCVTDQDINFNNTVFLVRCRVLIDKHAIKTEKANGLWIRVASDAQIYPEQLVNIQPKAEK